MRDGVSRLLARGGRALGIAAVAHARGQRAGGGPWYALSRETALAAEQALAALEEGVSRGELAAAIAAAMGALPATSGPPWSGALAADPDALLRVARGAGASWPESSPVQKPGDERELGIALVGLALCRSVDAARALAGTLPAPDGDSLVRWARLLQAVARPGEPSAARGAVRRALEGEPDGVRDSSR